MLWAAEQKTPGHLAHFCPWPPVGGQVLGSCTSCWWHRNRSWPVSVILKAQGTAPAAARVPGAGAWTFSQGPVLERPRGQGQVQQEQT